MKRSARVGYSTSPLVEEYIRSCWSNAKRSAGKDKTLRTWMDCADYMHPAYAALSQTTDILMNYLCNSAYSRADL